MRSFYYLIIATMFSLMMAQSAHADGVFKWKDARGNIQYGDEPPANAKLDKFKMPKIMIVDGFKEQWKPLEGDAPKAATAKRPTVQSPVVTLEKPSFYTKLAFIAPKDNQVIKSGFKGEVSAMISIKPPLKKGHQIVFELNGKAVAKGQSRINNFSNLNGGQHTVVAKIVNQNGSVLNTSSPVSFYVVRTKSSKTKLAN